MGLPELVAQVEKAEALDVVAKPLANLVGRLLPTGPAKDALSGTWLGHPLHPMLTDVPIGAWTSAAVLDVLGGRKGRRSADLLLALGVVSALPTAASGLSDWADTYGGEQRIGVVHALANTVALGLCTASLVSRARGRRWRGKLLSFAGVGAMTAGGYLGGHLSYAKGVGVNHTFQEHPPEDWTIVMSDQELAEARPTKAKADGVDVLLYRAGSTIYALSATCTHAGGPLAEGEVEDGCVQCPWHGSVFSLQDGSVVHGPASVPEPVYDVRVTDGKIEVRLRASR